MAAAAMLLQETAGADSVLSRFTLQATRATSARQAATPVLRIGGVELGYGARSNSLVFERTHLDRQLPHANPITVSMCEQMCRRSLDARRARVGTSTMVRHYLNAGRDPSAQIRQVMQAESNRAGSMAAAARAQAQQQSEDQHWCTQTGSKTTWRVPC